MMQKLWKFSAISLLLAGSLCARETILDMNLNDEDLEAGISQVHNWSKNSKTFFGGGFLNGTDEYGKQHTMIHAEATHMGLTEVRGFMVGLGAKAIHATLDDSDAGAFALRGKLFYTLPVKVNTILSASYNYAPKPLSFADLTRYSEARLEVNVEVIESGMVYGGWRTIDMEFDGGTDYNFNDALYLGIKVMF